jgi:rRNA-processing protein FCF1
MTVDRAVARYRSAGVLVDANLLLMYFVGVFDREAIPRFKRTSQFTPEDFDLLYRFLSNFERVVTTPHILTEVSNLAGQLPDHLRERVFEKLALGIPLLEERYTASKTIASGAPFVRFGLTDSAVLHHARGQYLVLTDDFRLSQYLQHEGVDVFNFNHLRFDVLLE